MSGLLVRELCPKGTGEVMTMCAETEEASIPHRAAPRMALVNCMMMIVRSVCFERVQLRVVSGSRLLISLDRLGDVVILEGDDASTRSVEASPECVGSVSRCVKDCSGERCATVCLVSFTVTEPMSPAGDPDYCGEYRLDQWPRQ